MAHEMSGIRHPFGDGVFGACHVSEAGSSAVSTAENVVGKELGQTAISGTLGRLRITLRMMIFLPPLSTIKMCTMEGAICLL